MTLRTIRCLVVRMGDVREWPPNRSNLTTFLGGRTGLWLPPFSLRSRSGRDQSEYFTVGLFLNRHD